MLSNPVVTLSTVPRMRTKREIPDVFATSLTSFSEVQLGANSIRVDRHEYRVMQKNVTLQA